MFPPLLLLFVFFSLSSLPHCFVSMSLYLSAGLLSCPDLHAARISASDKLSIHPQHLPKLFPFSYKTCAVLDYTSYENPHLHMSGHGSQEQNT